VDPKRASRLAKRLRRALGRKPGKRDKLRLSVRREELRQLCELAEHYAHLHAYLGSFDVQALLGCSRHRLNKLAGSGALPCTVLPSGHRRFVRKDVLEFLTRRKLVSSANTQASHPYNS
jgi:hypothetical protein